MKVHIALTGLLARASNLLVTTAILVSCHTNSGSYIWVRDLQPTAHMAVLDVLRPGDRVYIVVRGQESLTGEYEVRPGGEVVLPMIGPIPAAGGTPVQLSTLVRDRMKGVIVDPQVSAVLSLRKAMISVIGEVRTPGQYELSSGENVLRALARAGGLGMFANEDGIYVVRRRPPQRIRFRYSDLVNGDEQSNRFELADGDVIVVE